MRSASCGTWVMIPTSRSDSRRRSSASMTASRLSSSSVPKPSSMNIASRRAPTASPAMSAMLPASAVARLSEARNVSPPDSVSTLRVSSALAWSMTTKGGLLGPQAVAIVRDPAELLPTLWWRAARRFRQGGNRGSGPCEAPRRARDRAAAAHARRRSAPPAPGDLANLSRSILTRALCAREVARDAAQCLPHGSERLSRMLRTRPPAPASVRTAAKAQPPVFASATSVSRLPSRLSLARAVQSNRSAIPSPTASPFRKAAAARVEAICDPRQPAPLPPRIAA